MTGDEGHRKAAEQARCPIPLCKQQDERRQDSEHALRNWCGWFGLWAVMAYGKEVSDEPTEAAAVADVGQARSTGEEREPVP